MTFILKIVLSDGEHQALYEAQESELALSEAAADHPGASVRLVGTVSGRDAS